MALTDLRRITTSIGILLAALGYVMCGLRHVCMAGHMHHAVSPLDWVNDVWWLSAMAMAAVFCWKSNLRFKRSTFLGLVALAIFRLLLGSGGGLLFLIEMPVLLAVMFAALIGLKFPEMDRSHWSIQERLSHRRGIVKKWLISLGCLAFAGLAVYAAIEITSIIRKKSAREIEIAASALPFKREVTVNPGDAVVLVLPNRKTLAVWCEKPSAIMHGIHGGGANLEYGEQPFTPLEREEIKLSGGGTTSGEYRSYIRQGPVMQGAFSGPSEFIIYVNPYRISLDEQDISNGLRMIIAITEASEKELVGPKGEIDYHAKRLHDPDKNIRMDSISELEELLICGSIYAEPRRGFIIQEIAALVNDPDLDVRDTASTSLRELGDPPSILKLIQPLPSPDFLNPYEAKSLGAQTKECDSASDLEPVYQHVMTLFDSDQEKLREFAVNFFGATKPVEAAREQLLKAFDDPSAIVRAAALHALDNLYDGNVGDLDPTNDDQAREVAIRMLADPAPEVIIAALETSVYLGEERILPFHVIQPFLTHNHKGIRLAAVRALVFDKSDQAENVLLELTRDPDSNVRGMASECLGDAHSDRVRERMIELLGDRDPIVRIRAVQSLGNNPHPAAIQPIKNLLVHEQDADVIRLANAYIESQ